MIKKQIALYLGAHKTATTHLQGILLANRDVLAEKGVALSAPQDIRNEWLPDYFRAVRHVVKDEAIPQQLAEKLRALEPPQERWILTEENMIGVPAELSTHRGLYPFARQRLTTVRALFPEAHITLFFSVRSYDSFFRSMYSEVIRNRGFIPFEEFYDREAFERKSWVGTVEAFASVLPPEDIVLWRFEDFRLIHRQVLALMTGIDDVGPLIEAYSAETTRPSLSQKAVDLLAELAPAIGKKEALRLTERINAYYGVDRGHPTFQPFDGEQIEDMRARYSKDMARIARKFPGVRIVEPAESGPA